MEAANSETQLLGPGERDFHLAFNAFDEGNSKAVCGIDRRFEKRRLADPRLTVHDQNAASSLAGSLKQPVEHSTFALPPDQMHLVFAHERGRLTHSGGGHRIPVHTAIVDGDPRRWAGLSASVLWHSNHAPSWDST